MQNSAPAKFLRTLKEPQNRQKTTFLRPKNPIFKIHFVGTGKSYSNHPVLIRTHIASTTRNCKRIVCRILPFFTGGGETYSLFRPEKSKDRLILSLFATGTSQNLLESCIPSPISPKQHAETIDKFPKSKNRFSTS